MSATVAGGKLGQRWEKCALVEGAGYCIVLKLNHEQLCDCGSHGSIKNLFKKKSSLIK